MKTFQYAGGEIEIDVPDTWTQEMEDPDIGVFYSDAPDTGTLRLKAQTFHNASQVVKEDDVTEMLSALAERLAPNVTHEVELIDDRTQVVEFVQSFPEGEPPHIVATWLVGCMTPPHILQLALYTYTVPGEFAKSAATVGELRLVEQVVREARLSVPS